MLPEVLSAAVALAPVWPALGAIVITALLLPKQQPSERVVAGITRAAMLLTLASAVCGLLLWCTTGPVDYRLGNWYAAAEYSFPLVLLFDGLSAVMSAFIALILVTTVRFSVTYMHNERGFIRFFLLNLFFAAGMQLLVLGGSVELLFIGWEFVGITSVLLVAFFHERAQPVQAALRVLVTYRICDIGLLFGGSVFLLYASFPFGWLALCLAFLSGVQGMAIPALNAMMSRRVPPGHQGELQGLNTSLAALAILIANLMYNNMLAWFTGPKAPVHYPGIIFAMSASITVIALIALLRLPPAQDGQP